MIGETVAVLAWSSLAWQVWVEVACRRRRPLCTLEDKHSAAASLHFVFACRRLKPFCLRPQIGRGYPLNLSISLSGGKETNKDSPSNGE